jgi:hypothetical protein
MALASALYPEADNVTSNIDLYIFKLQNTPYLYRVLFEDFFFYFIKIFHFLDAIFYQKKEPKDPTVT